MQKISKNKIDYLEYRKGMADTLEIYDIAVMSERGKGIGTSLVKELIKKENPKIVYAFCRESNKLAHSFYRKFGFKGTVINNFYGEESGIIFVYETCK